MEWRFKSSLAQKSCADAVRQRRIEQDRRSIRHGGWESSPWLNMENLKHKFSELSQTKMKVEVEIPAETVKAETERIFVEIQKQSAIKGFRAGKAPLPLVKEKYSETARQHIVEDLINDTLPKILKEKAVETVGSPVLEKIDFNFEKPFCYTAVVEFHPKVAVKNYKGLKLKKEIKKITDKDVEKAIEELRKMNAKLVESDTPADDKSCVIIDYTVFSEDKKNELKELKAENQLVDLSEKQALTGLAEAMLGVHKGDKREVFTKIPDTYSKKELAGKNVSLNVEVKEVKNKILPELTDDFSKQMGAENSADLRKKVKERMTTETEKDAEAALEDQITKQLLEANNISVPESLVESQEHYLIHAAEDRLKYQGIPAQMLEKQKPEIKKKANEEAIKQVKLYYIMNAISEQEKIDVSEEEYNQKRDEALKLNPGREDYIKKYFEEGQDRLVSRMKTDRIFKFLKDNARIKVQEV